MAHTTVAVNQYGTLPQLANSIQFLVFDKHQFFSAFNPIIGEIRSVVEATFHLFKQTVGSTDNITQVGKNIAEKRNTSIRHYSQPVDIPDLYS